MAVKSGNKRRVYISATGSASSNTWIAGEQSNSVNYTNNALDASDKSTEWDQFISGNKSWTASATFNLDNAASGEQKKLLQALVSGAVVNVFIGELGSTNGRVDGVAGTAIITAISETAERNGIITREVTFTGSGAPTMVYPA
jgi:predicted secreted protein